MNTLPRTEIARINNTIALHLNLRVPFAITHQASPTTATVASSVGSETMPHQTPSCTMNDKVLYSLLLRYVDLLESPDHGGWTREEDAAVRETVEALAHTDCMFRLPSGVR